MRSVETLYCLLQDAAAAHGSCTAIDFDGRKLTYHELLDAADRMAGMLSDQGAAPGCRVAFCFRKSIEALITLFGIIRTGAAYVPIDPTWPEDRVAAICEDAEIRLWTGTSVPPKSMNNFKATFAVNAEGAIALASYQQHSPMAGPPQAPADGIANILFTSGSTGRPKGVLITTISLLHFSKWVVDYFGLTERDRLANHAPYNFDLSTLDIFAAVRAGAAMCPVPEKTKMFPYQTAKFIADMRITTWYSVPSALIMMQQRGKLGEHDFSALKHLIFAGEVMPKPALQLLSKEFPRATLTNLYGPTETNVCTYYRVDEAELASDGPVPIGFALNDTPLWIVDEQDRPVTEGESGQLLVAGPLVTAGYCGDSQLTATKLTNAPDGKDKVYRTGDRVRRRTDGALMFEGRMDRMIKCRGHRIEPGEIEAALHKHPSVKEAAVVPLPDPVFGNRILACLASKEGHALDEAALAMHCREHLPSYMMPDEWRFLEALPRTDRGKVDLQSLAGGKR